MNSQFDYLKAIIKPTKTKQKKMMEKKIRGGWRDVCDAEISFLGTRHDLTMNLLNYSFDRWDRFPLPPKKS